ncbi:hypothetical protein [Pseudomonas sp. LS-2]|uniref:hypothetical protein n=1 Tax=Pseudomonas sp. LS-2 TaxID=2315859 RepID=UPI000E707379|nr:hypothetical protein [Pseudomonas sp. LS-2]RJX80724.1 hypothetical protein D3M70_11155 [Pseudomonas sp. LS-2]
MKAFGSQVEAVKLRLSQLDISGAALTSSTNILNAAISFIGKVVGEGNFTIAEYTTFCDSIGPDILVNQTAAAVEQVAAMQAWRSSVGQATWDKMYVVLQCIWTVSQESAHEQIIKSQMKPEFHETHRIVSEAAPTLEDARLLLARILADRVLSAAVFRTHTGEDYKRRQPARAVLAEASVRCGAALLRIESG